ncbi:MAG: hypothetical protein WCW16_00790 [Candidatus Magasanikbacteria bacterium]
MADEEKEAKAPTSSGDEKRKALLREKAALEAYLAFLETANKAADQEPPFEVPARYGTGTTTDLK